MGCIPILYYMSWVDDYEEKYRHGFATVDKLPAFYIFTLFMIFSILFVLDIIFTGLIVYKSNRQRVDRNLVFLIISLCVNGYFIFVVSHQLDLPENDALAVKIKGLCLDISISIVVIIISRKIHKKLFSLNES